MTASPMQVPDFGDTALCSQTDPALFFPDATDVVGAGYAKAVCQLCPNVKPCRAWALAHHESGVWGGLDERERRDIQERRGIKPISLDVEDIVGRDRQVVALTAQGLSADEIATILRVTRRSVERIRARQVVAA